jgi:sulfotransferase family protein
VVDGDEQVSSGPIFLIGSMGSGSTLLRLVLDAHERIAIPQETSVMRLVAAHKWVPTWAHGDKWYGRLGMSEAQLDEELRGFYGGLFERYAQAQGAQRWGEKTPGHVWYMRQIGALFPDAQLVGIVRHPAAAAGSVSTRFGNWSYPDAVEHWRVANRQMLFEGSQLGERFVLCRYEDLVTHQEPVMRELLDWLGEPWSETVLAHHEAQRAKGAPAVVDGGTRPTDAVDPTRLARWRDTQDEQQRALVARRCAKWAQFFGYDVDQGLPVAPLVDPPGGERTYLATGTQLQARKAQFAGRLKFDPPPRPVAEQPLKPKVIAGAGQVSSRGTAQKVRRRLASLQRLRPGR